MKIGARVFKTGLAITLSIMVSFLLIPTGDGMLAAIGAAYSTQPSVKKTFETFLSRITSNAIGGIIAVGMIHFVGATPITIGISAILCIAILNALKLDDVIGLAVVTLIVIMLTQGRDYNETAFLRVADTFIGVTVTFFVNLLVFPPKYDAKFFHLLEFTTTETLIWIRASLRKNTEFSVMERDLKWALAKRNKLHMLFELIHQDIVFIPRKRIFHMRKLVVYRHMLRTTDASIRLLRVLHQNDYIYFDFPDELRIAVRNRLETLMSAHEQILLKFNGKVPPKEVNFMRMNSTHRDHYMQMFFEQARIQEQTKEIHHFEGNGVIHIMSAIYQYEESLTVLNHLVRNFKMHSATKDIYIEMNDSE